MSDTMIQRANVRSINMASLEADLHAVAKKQMPSMAELGQIGAEAVIKQYETAAKNVEAMGAQVRERVAKLNEALTETHEDLRLISEAADHIRDKGKHVEMLIAEASTFSKGVREICAAITEKTDQ